MRLARNAIGALWTAHLRRREHWEDLAQLRAMSDPELRDIGISRCEIRGLAVCDKTRLTSHDRPARTEITNDGAVTCQRPTGS